MVGWRCTNSKGASQGSWNARASECRQRVGEDMGLDVEVGVGEFGGGEAIYRLTPIFQNPLLEGVGWGPTNVSPALSLIISTPSAPVIDSRGF